MICGPREKFTAAEFETFKQYLNRGGSLLVMMGEGGEDKYGTNINYLLEQFGVMINSGKFYTQALLYFSLVSRTMHMYM